MHRCGSQWYVTQLDCEFFAALDWKTGKLKRSQSKLHSNVLPKVKAETDTILWVLAPLVKSM